MNGFDVAYGVIGAAIVLGVWIGHDPPTAFWIGVLMVLCYCAGSVKYRHR